MLIIRRLCQRSYNSKENTLISSKAGDVTVADTMKKIGKDQIANASFTEMLSKILADKYKNES